MLLLQLFLFFATLLAGSMLLLNTLAICILVVWSWVDKKGNVKNVFVERSSGYAPVDEAVKKAILQWKFTPAIGTDQKAHESIIGMTITLPKQAVKAK